MSFPENIFWQIKIPLINNRFIIGNVLKGIAMTLLLFFLILGSIFGWANGIKGVEQAFIACFWAGIFLVIISIFALAIFLGNAYLLEFSMNEEGVIMKSRSERAHFAHRLALILGVLGWNPATVGAGAAGVAGETSRMPWSKIKSIKVYSDKKIIRLKRNFLETMFVYCTQENYESVAAFIAKMFSENKGLSDGIAEGVSGMRGNSASLGKDISYPSVSASCPKCNAKDFSCKAADAARCLKSTPGKEVPKDKEKELDDEIRREEILECLARPEEPLPFSLSRWALVMFIPVINIIAIFFAPLVKRFKIFISMIDVLFIISVVWAVGFAGDPENAKMAVGSLGLLMCVLYRIGLVYSWNVAKADCGAKRAEYQRILPRWEHLLYCEKCEAIFFDDRPGHSAPVKDVRSFLGS